MKFQMKLQQGTQRARRYWRRLRRDDRSCPGGDCLCDFHEGKTDRVNSRAFRNRGLRNLWVEYG